MTLPHVVGLLATQNRPEQAHRAAHLFFEQDYPGTKSLVVFDDGEDFFQACGALDALNVVYHSRVSLPAKRNQMVRHVDDPDAIYFVWDDDDYHGPARVRRQVEALLASGAEGCLLRPFLYFHQIDNVMRRSVAQSTDATLAFRHAFWRARPWDEKIDPGSGYRMINKRESMVYVDGAQDYVVVWHGKHRFPHPPNLFSEGWEASDLSAEDAALLLAPRDCI